MSALALPIPAIASRSSGRNGRKQFHYQDNKARCHRWITARCPLGTTRRRATLHQLAAEVLAAVLAELLHLTPGTAHPVSRRSGERPNQLVASCGRGARTQPVTRNGFA